MLGGGEEMFVVRVDLAEAVFLRADEVEGVGGAEELLLRQIAIVFPDILKEFPGDWKKGPATLGDILEELANGLSEKLLPYESLAPFAMDCGRHLDFGQPAR